MNNYKVIFRKNISSPDHPNNFLFETWYPDSPSFLQGQQVELRTEGGTMSGVVQGVKHEIAIDGGVVMLHIMKVFLKMDDK